MFNIKFGFLRISSLVFVCLFGFGLLSQVAADQRNYVWTYEYQTMPQGEAEIEYYMTQENPSSTDYSKSTWKPLVELEYGLTDHWDVSLYHQFKQTNTAAASTLSYDGFKARTRYRIGEKNQLPFDTLLYLEYIGKNALNQTPQGEMKLILAKDISNINFSYNQIYKWNLQGGAFEHEYSAGVSVQAPRLSLGFEAKGNYTAGKHAFGPTISMTANKFWTSLGTVIGLNSNTDASQTRILIGIWL
ncbi:hypothetical protein HZC34_00870 [Candidatus Saganbacteria bacterium]|nr:hypothetical protein [Candidatus Saganbacteria bacterium]